MVVSLKRIFSVAILSFALLQPAVSRPLRPSLHDLVERELAELLYDRDYVDMDLSTRAERLADFDLDMRDSSLYDDLEARSNAEAAALDAAAGSSGGRGRYQPNPARITIGDSAKEELNRMNLHGKQRKNVIKWNKKQVKKEMGTMSKATDDVTKKPVKAEISHLAHKGGSVRKEKNHITAEFSNVHGNKINNKYNGGTNHHIYVNKGNSGVGARTKNRMERNDHRINKPGQHMGNVKPAGEKGKSTGKGKGKQRQGGATKNENRGSVNAKGPRPATQARKATEKKERRK